MSAPPSTEPYGAFWGKAGDDGFHPAALHMLDVAAVAHQYLTATGHRWPGLGDTDEGQLSTIAALIALHDIGKFSRPFQAKRPDLWPDHQLGPQGDELSSPRHDTAGYQILCRRPPDPIREILGEVKTAGGRQAIWRAICGHHGTPPGEELDAIDHRVWCDGAERAAGTFASDLVDLLGPVRLPSLTSSQAVTFAWHLAGLAVLADWIGSDSHWFPMASEWVPLDAYWPRALDQARIAVWRAGVLPIPPARISGTTLIPSGRNPTPLQSLAEAIDLGSSDQPSLILVEDQTGSGKTEAVLILASRLMTEKAARGVFIALPTMATANGLYDRLSRLYSRLFDGTTQQPSLVLAHGRRGLHERFMTSVREAPSPAADSWGAPADADETASAQCAGWIASDHRRTFLADCGVGTIDQALMAVLPTRHAPLRMFGIADRVLVIDEVHAYDSFMWEEILRLVEFQTRLGGHCVMLSATLSMQQRAQLVNRYRKAIGLRDIAMRSEEYPLVTVACADTCKETQSSPREELARSFAIDRLDAVGDAVEEVVRAAEAGAAVAWIRNTVDDAIAAHAALVERGIRATLFHARFAMGDRLSIEDEVLQRFGRDSDGDERAHVVVGTQVMEQSLDLDFDVLVTDLAPIDLLLQRAGRLWRHPGRARPIGEPRLKILSPAPVDDADPGWLSGMRGTLAVYRHPGLLWRSARTIFSKPTINLPADVRSMIEAVYASDAAPAGLIALGQKIEAEDRKAAGLARNSLLKWSAGYAIDNGAWTSETRAMTRLADPTIKVRLAVMEDGALRPWHDQGPPRLRWALSEVSISTRRVDIDAAPDLDAVTLRAVEALRETWPRLDQDIRVLVLEPEADGRWSATGMPCRKAETRIKYNRTVGLSFPTR